ncbi:hypothetical protein D3C85_1494940 [compost metagenome]
MSSRIRERELGQQLILADIYGLDSFVGGTVVSSQHAFVKPFRCQLFLSTLLPDHRKIKMWNIRYGNKLHHALVIQKRICL